MFVASHALFDEQELSCSTKGLGSVAPDPKEFKVLPDGVVVPMGKPSRDDRKHVCAAPVSVIDLQLFQLGLDHRRECLLIDCIIVPLHDCALTPVDYSESVPYQTT